MSPSLLVDIDQWSHFLNTLRVWSVWFIWSVSFNQKAGETRATDPFSHFTRHCLLELADIGHDRRENLRLRQCVLSAPPGLIVSFGIHQATPSLIHYRRMSMDTEAVFFIMFR